MSHSIISANSPAEETWSIEKSVYWWPNPAWILGQAWLIWGQGLFIASAVIWVLILIPTQIAQAQKARTFAQGGQIPEGYWRLGRRWAIWGTIATLLPLANLYFMVFKP